jgi:hypothetical protein
VIPRWWLLAFIVAVSLVALVERTSLRGRWRALVLDAAFAPADWAARPPRPHRVTSPRTAWTVWTITPEAA